MSDQVNYGRSEPPVACDITSMDSEQRDRYRELRRLLRDDVEEVRELADGYAFRYPLEKSVLLALAEFISLERLCCPFLDFLLEVERGGGPIWFRMTGTEEAREVLRAELAIRA